jgi:ESS family glutamate:Na+ symporter
LGAGINCWIAPLRRWNIPEAVTGGLLAAVVTLIAHEAFGLAIMFDLGARDMLLLYFFTGIGLNARLSDLLTGGRPFFILLALTIVFLVIQNLVAAASVGALGLPKGITVLLGSASLIGGHGTTIAWAPLIETRFGLTNATEIGVAAATLGLVVASMVGGPVAGFLISRHGLRGEVDEAPVVGLADVPDESTRDDLNHVSLLRTILVLNSDSSRLSCRRAAGGDRYQAASICLVHDRGDRAHQCHSAFAAASALAITYARAGVHLGFFAEHLSGLIIDEHS